MILQLQNFRCWKEKRFEFLDEGLVLLSGKSGVGKTSILSAIYFALYGVGTKIISFGEKKCLVRLVIGDFDITRTKGPNRLILIHSVNGINHEYEDDVAQAILVKRFGKNFTITSYITQKSVQTFLNLSPSEKMTFLESLALGDEEITEIKKDIKEMIKEKKENLQKHTGQLELLKKEVSQMKEPLEIPFPLGKTHSDVKIKNESIYWKRTSRELKEKRSELHNLEEEWARERVQIALDEKCKQILSDINTREEELISEKNLLNFTNEDEESIVELNSVLNYLKKKREYNVLKSRYTDEKRRLDSLVQDEKSVLLKESLYLQGRIDETRIFSEDDINSLERDVQNLKQIKSATDDLESIKSRLSELECLQANKDNKDVTDIEKEIEDLRQNISSNEQRIHIKSCPNCKVSLRVDKNVLVLSSDDPVDENSSREEVCRLKKEIEIRKKTINEIQRVSSLISQTRQRRDEYEKLLKTLKLSTDETMEIEKLKRDLENMRECKQTLSTLKRDHEKILKKIKDGELSPSLTKLKHESEKNYKELQKIESEVQDEIETDYTEDELRSEITRLGILCQKKNSLDKQLSILSSSKTKAKNDRDKIIISSRNYEEEINVMNQQIKDLVEKEMDHRNLNEKIKLYEQAREERGGYLKWVDKLNKSATEEERAKNECSLCEIFLRKVLEAESLAISETIDRINSYMNSFLEHFFPDNPITVLVSPYKETKKDIKSLVSINVGYKGLDTTLDCLSGGEYDRVSLALFLSLNKMFGSNLLMLDESISSLDNELTGDIIEVLKEKLGEKIVFIVSHQIESGMFDQIVEV